MVDVIVLSAIMGAISDAMAPPDCLVIPAKTDLRPSTDGFSFLERV